MPMMHSAIAACGQISFSIYLIQNMGDDLIRTIFVRFTKDYVWRLFFQNDLVSGIHCFTPVLRISPATNEPAFYYNSRVMPDSGFVNYFL